MRPTNINNWVADDWLTASYQYLVGRPLNHRRHNSLFSSLDHYGFFQNNFLETPDGYTVEVAVPGMCKKDLHLEVDKNMLLVRGRKEQKEKSGWFSKTAGYRSTEICKTFELPEDADADGIRAKCKEGLLKVSIPKIKTSRKYKNIPVKTAYEPAERNWWRKLTQPFKALWNKGRNSMKQLAAGF